MVSESPVPPVRQEDGSYNSGEKKDYEKKKRQQKWICTCVGNVNIVKQGENQHLMYADFKIQNKQSKKYLGKASESVVTVDTPQTWTLSMEQIGPGDLVYHPNPFSIYTNSKDEKMIPSFNVCGSSPLTWEINPQLNKAFELIKQGNNQGIIRQKAGQVPNAVSDTHYTVTVSNEINDQKYSSKCDITINVEKLAQDNSEKDFNISKYRNAEMETL